MSTDAASTESSVGVPNTGSAPIEVRRIENPDGTVVLRQVIDVNEMGSELARIRKTLELMFVLLTSNKPIAIPSGRALPFDLNGNLKVGISVSPDNEGASVARLIALGTTNATMVKANTGQIYGWHIFNAAAAVRFVKLYNSKKTPVVGTDTPVVTLPFPAGAAANVWLASGLDVFPEGIGFATTVNAADSDTTAVTAGDLIINLWYF